MPPRLVAPAQVVLDLKPDGAAMVHYRATWAEAPKGATLSWTGRRIRSVRVERSTGSRGLVFETDGGVLVRLGDAGDAGQVTIDIEYDIELDQLTNRTAAARWLSIDNIPTLRSRLLSGPAAGTGSPWREDPDLVITLRSPSGWDILGPRYVSRPSDGSLSPRSIALYSGERTGYVLVGEFARRGVTPTTSVLVPTPQRDEIGAQLLETLARLSTSAGCPR